MRHISNITLVAVATTEVEATLKAIEYSTKDLHFDKVILLSHYKPESAFNRYDYIKIEPFANVGDWGRFIVFDLYKFITTDYIILIHADGFIVNPASWDESFLEYDYIGAPWPIPTDKFSYRDYFGNIIRVGNSVSLRSYKLLKMPSDLNLRWDNLDNGYFHEDGFLAVQFRHVLQENGIKFAPFNVACKFSRERTLYENKDIHPFAFHKWQGRNNKYPRFNCKKSIFSRLKSFLTRFFKDYLHE